MMGVDLNLATDVSLSVMDHRVGFPVFLRVGRVGCADDKGLNHPHTISKSASHQKRGLTVSK